MRKAKLLGLKKLNVTQSIEKAVTTDIGEEKVRPYNEKGTRVYKACRYYRATVEEGTLKIALFLRTEIMQGKMTPRMEIYIDKEEKKWINYEPNTGRWLTAKIGMIDIAREEGEYYYGLAEVASDKTKQLVNEYLETGELDVRGAVAEYQRRVKEESVKEKYKRETDEIDEVMNAVPKLPKDFDEWIVKEAYYHERYLFYHAGTKRGHCMHCGQQVELKDRPMHNTIGKCTACKSRVMLKAWRKQKHIVDEKNVGILQKLTNGTGYMLRVFRCNVKRSIKNNWEIDFAGCWEEYRWKLNERFERADLFEYGEHPKLKTDRWCHEIKRGMGWYYWGNTATTECILYGRNLTKLLHETELTYMPIAQMMKKTMGTYTKPMQLLQYCYRTKTAEILLKEGLYKLLQSASREKIPKGTLNETEKNLWSIIKVPKSQASMCKKMNISERELQVLQKANEYNITLKQEQIEFWTKTIGPASVDKILKYGHIHKFERYFKEELEAETQKRQASDYLDYLRDLEGLGVHITKQELFPRNFQRVHTEIANLKAEKEEKIAKMKINQKNRTLRRMLPELLEIYKMENEKYTVVIPTCKTDFVKEGQQNHNCVAGYFERMVKRNCVVFFIRKKSNLEESYCTVEMVGDKVMQCRGKFNGDAPKEVDAFMKELQKQVQKKLIEKREKEMKQKVVAMPKQKTRCRQAAG